MPLRHGQSPLHEREPQAKQAAQRVSGGAWRAPAEAFCYIVFQPRCMRPVGDLERPFQGLILWGWGPTALP